MKKRKATQPSQTAQPKENLNTLEDAQKELPQLTQKIQEAGAQLKDDLSKIDMEELQIVAELICEELKQSHFYQLIMENPNANWIKEDLQNTINNNDILWIFLLLEKTIKEVSLMEERIYMPDEKYSEFMKSLVPIDQSICAKLYPILDKIMILKPKTPYTNSREVYQEERYLKRKMQEAMEFVAYLKGLNTEYKLTAAETICETIKETRLFEAITRDSELKEYSRDFQKAIDEKNIIDVFMILNKILEDYRANWVHAINFDHELPPKYEQAINDISPSINIVLKDIYEMIEENIKTDCQNILWSDAFELKNWKLYVMLKNSNLKYFLYQNIKNNHKEKELSIIKDFIENGRTHLLEQFIKLIEKEFQWYGGKCGSIRKIVHRFVVDLAAKLEIDLWVDTLRNYWLSK